MESRKKTLKKKALKNKKENMQEKFVNDNDLQWILNGIRDDAVLTAYALDAIKERKTEDFHI